MKLIVAFKTKQNTWTKNLLGIGFTLECRAAVYRLYTESTRVRVKFLLIAKFLGSRTTASEQS